MVPRLRTDFDPPDAALGLARVSRASYEDRSTPGRLLRASVAGPSMPLGVPRQERGAVVGALEQFLTGRYDLVWCFGVRSWVLSGQPSFAPTVIDFDDLEDQKILARLSIPRPGRRGWLDAARSAAGRAFSELEVRRWRHLYRLAGRSAAATVVCSSLDAHRARAGGVAKVDVVPNAYRLMAPPVGRESVASPPTLVFQGTLRYPPNADGARFLVREVGPALRELVPQARIRLVGRSTPALAALHDPPEVTMVDQVPDITAELAHADLVVVPVRFGSGTRVKILEAFAHEIPVVSTGVGAEGLGVRDGIHLLVADSPGAMAAAIARLLRDRELRRRLVTSARKLFEERFRSDEVEDEIGRLAERVAFRRSS